MMRRRIEFIDAHVHVRTGDHKYLDLDPYVRSDPDFPKDTDALADLYRELKGMAVIFDIDDETRTGMRASNAEIAELMQRHPDVFIAFGTIDPWKGKVALDEVARCAELGLRGLKFHPPIQDFRPNDPRFYTLWELCSQYGLIVLFHTGTTMAHSGKPGGGGIRLDYGRPVPYIDDIAALFPDLTIIMAHPAWPWHEEQLAILRHKPNVFMDLSGWLPKYFPESVIRMANTLLQDKMLFGSDFPMIHPQRWIEDFRKLPIKEVVLPKILFENAARLFSILTTQDR
ncbi:amidohydrolase [Thermus thermamylovorans]|uniref:Amidohydrolase n=1 Tax=Thermus thermamylovorans TaxID=2509362 RepID=A0A4V2IUF8_9DEIN|nr:amidohydrolase [Thermus thermamylovorans]